MPISQITKAFHVKQFYVQQISDLCHEICACHASKQNTSACCVCSKCVAYAD